MYRILHVINVLLLVTIIIACSVDATVAVNPFQHHHHHRLKVFSPKIPNPTEGGTAYDDDGSSPEELPASHDSALYPSVPTTKPNYDVDDDNGLSSSSWKQLRKRLRKGSFDLVPLKKEKHPKRASSSSSRKKQTTKVKSTRKSTSLHGTTFDLRRPTPERIAKWFAPSSSSSASPSRRKRRQQLFNHDSVGMTNPVLQVSLPLADHDARIHLDTGSTESPSSRSSLASSSSSSSTSAAISSSSSSQEFEVRDTWIPASSSSNANDNKSTQDSASHQWARVLQYKVKPQDPSPEAAETAWWPTTSQHSNKQQQQQWRQCLYRRRVGKGQACYERVRDAALQWQFQHTQTNEKGILPVLSSSQDTKNDFLGLDDQAAQHVQSIWSGPHSRGSRRLVTFTTCGFKSRWLPKLYTMNPVMVVYDLLDQRGPGTTYTSTAYATLQGHLLAGEERVTVALRDDSEFVDVEILSYSKPGQGIKAKAAWPLIGTLQSTFFQHQMDYLEQVALPKPPPAPTTTTKKQQQHQGEHQP